MDKVNTDGHLADGGRVMDASRGFLPEDVETYIEIRGIYDGWSVAYMKDGRMLNRWPPSDRRHKPTQDFIDRKALGTGE